MNYVSELSKIDDAVNICPNTHTHVPSVVPARRRREEKEKNERERRTMKKKKPTGFKLTGQKR